MAARPTNYSRDHFIWLLLQFTLIFGVTNHVFNRKKRQFVYSPKAFIYRVFLHLTSFVLILVSSAQLVADTSHLFDKRQFVKELSYGCVYIYTLVIIHSLFSEWINRRRVTQPFNELLRVHIDNLINSPKLAKIQRNTWKLLFWKSLSVFLVAVTTLLTVMTQCRLTAQMIASVVGFNFLILVYVSIQYQFYIAMLYGGYLFKVLNLRLSQIVKDINDSLYLSHRKSQRLSEELIKLGICHSNLLKLVTRIKDIYQFDLLVILSTIFTLQLCAIFFVMVASMGILARVTPEIFITAFGYTFVSTIDLLISLYICGDCVNACNASSGILKDLRRLQVFHRSLDKDIDTLFLQLAREKMHLTICGLFELNIDTGPAMIEGIMMKLILLTQIGYHDLQ